jgi:competence ComEA-like helix-hairpin-helix protein
MSTFSTTTLDPAVLDPRKRVRYATGLVLGVDEFQQDQTYHMEQGRRHQRALHGYGTVYGLDVRARVRDGEAEVLVTPGLAVDPRGRDICVPEPQCARLDGWLAANTEAVLDAAGSLPDALALYVVLCYRECETDRVPLPGTPCRTEDDAHAPSRIADHFELALVTAPPAYAEERAVRRFGALLRRLRVSDEAPVLTADALADLVRALPEASEGDADAPLHLHPEDAADLVRLAFRVWAVEVRPRLNGEGGCAPPATDACVVLARLDLALAEDGGRFRVDPAASDEGGAPGVTVHQEDRPYLVSTRVLQEWLALCAPGLEPEPGSFPETELLLALNDLIDVEAAPSAGDVLTWDDAAGAWVAAPPPGGGTSAHGALLGLDADDHPQYLLVDGSRPMAGDLDAGGNRVVGLAEGSAPGEAVPFQQAVKRGDAAGGDLAGTYPDPAVRRLQGRPVANTGPAPGQALTWNGAAWAPQTIVTDAGNFEEELVRIQEINWRHGDLEATLPQVQVEGERTPEPGLVLGFGVREPGDREVLVGLGSLDFMSLQVFGYVFNQNTTYIPLGLVPSAIDPVEVRQRGATWGVRLRSTDEDLVAAPAALFRFQRGFGEGLPETGMLFHVVLRGDFVLEATDERRAIDAEHLRGALPSGDRPREARRGLQGGRFESWFMVRRGRGTISNVGRQPLRDLVFATVPGSSPRPEPDPREVLVGVSPGGRVDLRRATAEELVALPGIGATLAERIVEAREGGERFDTPEALLRVPGITERTLEGLRGRLRF